MWNVEVWKYVMKYNIGIILYSRPIEQAWNCCCSICEISLQTFVSVDLLKRESDIILSHVEKSTLHTPVPSLCPKWSSCIMNRYTKP